MNTIKKAVANITAVLSIFILTLSIIDFVNPSINMLDNMGARIILVIYCVFSLACSVIYLCHFFHEKLKKPDSSERKD